MVIKNIADARCGKLNPNYFLYVFCDINDVPSGSYREIRLVNNCFYVDENGQFSLARTLAETMYRGLNRPATFNIQYIHGSLAFEKVTIQSSDGGRFVSTNSAKPDGINMPSVLDIMETLSATELFRPIGKTDPLFRGEVPAIVSFLKEVLTNPLSDLDKSLEQKLLR